MDFPQRYETLVGERGMNLSGGQRIAVLDRGQIIELGTHDELMQHNGLYARLYTMQLRDAENGFSAQLREYFPPRPEHVGRKTNRIVGRSYGTPCCIAA